MASYSFLCITLNYLTLNKKQDVFLLLFLDSVKQGSISRRRSASPTQGAVGAERLKVSHSV